MKFISKSEKETFEFAKDFADKLDKGTIIFLDGEMGSGKTAFTKGLLSGLGYKGEVTSPTFALCHIYNLGIPILHYDLYRIQDCDDLYSTGFFEDCGKDNITIVEWSGIAKEYFPEAIQIKFEYGSTPEERIITIE